MTVVWNSIHKVSSAAALGTRVRELRKALGLTLADLSLVCGVEPTYLSRIECGRRVASVEALAAIALSLDTTLDFLFCGGASLREAWTRSVEKAKHGNDGSADGASDARPRRRRRKDSSDAKSEGLDVSQAVATGGGERGGAQLD